MAEVPGDLLPFSSSAYLLSSLPHLHERVIRDPSRPSGVRVLGRSMFVLAAGWLVAFGWLALSGAVSALGWSRALALGVLPAVAMSAIGWGFAHYIGRAPYRELEWREWRHAFWWATVPNALLLSTAWIILSVD